MCDCLLAQNLFGFILFLLRVYYLLLEKHCEHCEGQLAGKESGNWCSEYDLFCLIPYSSASDISMILT